MDDEEKRDEEQEVRDTDADTKDELESQAETRAEVHGNATKEAEINRKIDSIIESQSMMMQAIAQLSRDFGTRNTSNVMDDEADTGQTLEDLDYSL